MEERRKYCRVGPVRNSCRPLPFLQSLLVVTKSAERYILFTYMSNLEDVKRKFGNKIIGSQKVQNLVCSVVGLLPSEKADFVTKNVWFVNSFSDASSFVLRGDELAGKYLVFLSDEVFKQPKSDQYYEVAHEIGHILLNHRNSIGISQTSVEIEKQERQAEQFAYKLLKM